MLDTLDQNMAAIQSQLGPSLELSDAFTKATAEIPGTVAMMMVVGAGEKSDQVLRCD